MAKTAFQIQMEYNNAKKQAKRLREIANNINKSATDDLMSNMDQLGSAWKSDTSNQFRQKGQKVSNNLVNVARNFRQAADTIERIAINTYNAEMRALEVAKTRKY